MLDFLHVCRVCKLAREGYCDKSHLLSTLIVLNELIACGKTELLREREREGEGGEGGSFGLTHTYILTVIFADQE